MKDLFRSLNKRPIAYYPAYAQISGSVKAGILLSQIMYWYEAMKEDEFYKSEKDWLEELSMNREEFRNAKKTLEALDLITVEVRGNVRKTYYYPEIDNIISMISKVVKHDNGKSGKTTSGSSETRQCTYTENTTETTKEIAADAALPFSLSEEIKKMEDDPKRHINIIAYYFDQTKPDIRSKEQLSVAIKRHSRAASSLKHFTDEQIVAAAKKCRKDFGDKGIEWTLESIIKVLTK